MALIAGCQQSSARMASHPSFQQRYAPRVTLPISLKKFLANLERNSLKYEILTGQNARASFPLPKADASIDTKNLAGCVQVYGKFDKSNRSMEGYRAYFDYHENVVYIENAFVYTGT